MLQYGWDGNIRELRNTIEYLKYMDLHTITYDDLPEIMQQKNRADNRIELREPAVAMSQQSFGTVFNNLRRQKAGIPFYCEGVQKS